RSTEDAAPQIRVETVPRTTLKAGETMEYVNFGKTGLKVSRICLGCMTYGEPAPAGSTGPSHVWTLNEQESQPFLREALDFGINFFDTANVYSKGKSEEVVGKFLKATVHTWLGPVDPAGAGS